VSAAGPPPPRPEPADDGADGAAPEPGCATGLYTARDLRHQIRFLLWMAATAAGYIGATAAQRHGASIPMPLRWGIVGLACLLALQAIRSYLAFLRTADELLRRIQMEALALGFGVGAAFSVLYPLLEGLGAPRLSGRAGALAMLLAWSAGSWIGERRYSGKGDA
jgi:hypothetical protein